MNFAVVLYSTHDKKERRDMRLKIGFKTMNVHKVFIINCLFFIFIHKIVAADAQQVFKEANAAYAAANYSLAVEKYEAILNEKVFSKELYYNLANSYYRLNKTGKAVLNYERALRLAPADGDIKNNLSIAKSRIVEDIEPISNVFIVRWWRILRGGMSADSWSVWGIMFLWVGIAGIALWLLSTERLMKKRGFLTGVVLIPLSILPFLLARDAQLESNIDYMGVITVTESTFRASPDVNAAPVAVLHEGIKIQILDKIAQLIKVRLPNGEEGWIEEGTIERI